MATIAVVDYNMGNLRSVEQALAHVCEDTIKVTSSATDILHADRVVFPGQGAARDCMKELANHDLLDVVVEAAKTKPFLGICMGMQVLLEHSQENNGVDCLGLYQGEVKAFKQAFKQTAANEQLDAALIQGLKIPHMGWNSIQQSQAHPLWQNIPDQARFYFVHSYYVVPQDSQLIAGQTDYGIGYASAIARDNIFAIQAHPEKSAQDGLQLLKNFTRWNGQA